MTNDIRSTPGAPPLADGNPSRGLEGALLAPSQGTGEAPGTGGTAVDARSSNARALEEIYPGAAMYRTANVNEWRPDIDRIVGEQVKEAKAAGKDKESCPHASWTAGWWAWHRAWGKS
jgi:hypothetical protein